MKQHGFRYCTVCRGKLQKRGRTAAGTQRWFCMNCGKSETHARTDLRDNHLLTRFVGWLLGKKSQEELGISARTWRSQVVWCWSITPPQPSHTESCTVLLVDGIVVGSRVCLIARTTEYVVGWKWVDSETSSTWESLFVDLPIPLVVVVDGQKGILLAVARIWPEAKVQRCLVHVERNIRTKLTRNPQSEAGKALSELTQALWRVRSPEEANWWTTRFLQWLELHDAFLRERTTGIPLQGKRRSWWYTHGRIRSAAYQYRRLLAREQLFTHLICDMGEIIPRTTNHVEGGINSPIRTLLKIHRGLSQGHQQVLVNWYLNSRTREPKPPRNCR
jgi:hypothetical protein